MNDLPPSVVFDCNVYLQAMLSDVGPANACLARLSDAAYRLWVSDAVLSEIRSLPDKPSVRRVGITPLFIERFIAAVLPLCDIIPVPPPVFVHPVDPKDSRYIDLAVAANATLIVSRDNHLLHLTNPAKPWSLEFRTRFPAIEIITPVDLLLRLDQHGIGGGA